MQKNCINERKLGEVGDYAIEGKKVNIIKFDDALEHLLNRTEEVVQNIMNRIALVGNKNQQPISD